MYSRLSSKYIVSFAILHFVCKLALCVGKRYMLCRSICRPYGDRQWWRSPVDGARKEVDLRLRLHGDRLQLHLDVIYVSIDVMFL
jgi:hypothetical protein